MFKNLADISKFVVNGLGYKAERRKITPVGSQT
jgi:hypothetical protein